MVEDIELAEGINLSFLYGRDQGGWAWSFLRVVRWPGLWLRRRVGVGACSTKKLYLSEMRI